MAAPKLLSHDCSLTCCCKSCGPLSLYTYKAGSAHDGSDKEGLVHDDKNVTTDDGEMSASCILATSIRDRQGDVIECSGVDFAEHRENPVVLWDHGRQDNRPIGITETPEGEYTVEYHPDGDFITQKTYFAPLPFSTQIYALVKGRYIRANSIAIKDLQVEKLSADPDNGHFKPGKWIKRSSLAEVTWTPLPANPEAVYSLLSTGKIDGGGFARENLHPLILKSFQSFAPTRNRSTSNGYTLKSHTAAGPDTEKGSTPMADYLRRKNEELDEPEVAEESPAEEMPPGAQHIHDHHELLMAHKGMLEDAKRHQENPGVREMIDAHKDMLDTMAQEARDRFAEEYPEHKGPEEEKSELADSEDGERTRPGEVNSTRSRPKPDKEPGGNRVDDEEKSAKRRSNMTKKAHGIIEEAALRTYAREQAAWMADQEEIAELEKELEVLEGQAS